MHGSLLAWPKLVPMCSHPCRGLRVPRSPGGSTGPCGHPRPRSLLPPVVLQPQPCCREAAIWQDVLLNAPGGDEGTTSRHCRHPTGGSRISSPLPQSWTPSETCSPAPSRTGRRASTSPTWQTPWPSPARSGRTVKPPRPSLAPPPPPWSTWTPWSRRRRQPRRATLSSRVGPGVPGPCCCSWGPQRAGWERGARGEG